jgi:hypothetical protein
MKTEITKSGFMDAFNNCGRGEQFSYDAKSALYDWLEELSEETGEEYSLDVIALCCEFTEYETALDCIEECGYGCDLEGIEDDEKNDVAFDYLNDHTMVCVFNGGIIIQDF